MKNKIILILIFMHFHIISWGQEYQTDSVAQAEITRLQFMLGRWEGTGWMMGMDGERHLFDQTEYIQFKVDSTLLLIEGRGRSQGKTIHHALAVVSYDKQARNYIFQSYLSDGRNGSFEAELIGDKFYWYPNEMIRYVIGLNDQGKWNEVGQMKRNDTWFQFFEMTLDKMD